MPSLPKIQIPANGWRPRDYQMPVWTYLERGGRRAVEVAHRRFGKDDVALHYTATRAMRQDRVGNYWHMLPQYGQARKVIWDAINPKTGKKRIDEAFPEIIRRRTNINEMLIEFRTGSIWQLVGSDNYNAIVGAPPIGIVFSEWALANPMAWAYLAPILEENGGWALFIYTSRGNNHGRTMYDHARNTLGWWCERKPATETGVFSPDQLDRILREQVAVFGQELGQALFNQEYLCAWEGAVLGAYFSAEMSKARSEGRVGQVPHDPGLGVATFWDLGIDDSMSIWFAQFLGGEIRLIDYYESQGYGLDHYFGVLGDKAASRGWWYEGHVGPHDLEVRELGTGKSRVQYAQDQGFIFQVAARPEKKEDGIQAIRQLLPRCWFDEEHCKMGISALENYHAEYDEEKKVISRTPAHDWASHGADAFQTLALTHQVEAVWGDLGAVFGRAL